MCDIAVADSLLNKVRLGDDGKNRLDARTYRAVRMAEYKKTAEKRSYDISKDSGNDLHVEGSRKSDRGCASCEPSCKRQRVGLATQLQICSCDGVEAPSRKNSAHPKDAYTQDFARSPKMDGSPISKEEGDEGENIGAHEEGEIVEAEEDVYTQDFARSPKMDGSPISKEEGDEGENIGAQEEGEIVEAEEDVYTQDFARSPKMDGSPISKEEGDEGENIGSQEEGEIVEAEENGMDASHDQSPLVSEGSPNAHPAGLNDLRFREYWVPVELSNVQLEQYLSVLVTNSGSLCSSAKKGILKHLHGCLHSLRKCCDHPYVLDPTLQSFSKKRSPSVDYLTIGIQASGKLQLLNKFLPQLKEQGLRVLIVYKTTSNPTKNGIGIGHILDDFICQSFGQESYVHIYTQRSVPQKERQAAVDLFNEKTNGRFVALIEFTEYKSFHGSTRLSSVDAVILFNSDWNPVNDIRALQKMKIHTENDHLRVFRLYSVCTLEEKALGLEWDTVRSFRLTNSLISMSTCHMLLPWGAAYLFDKLDALHAISTSESTQSSESEFLCSIIQELSTILSSKVDDPSISCSLISKVSEVGRGYPGNVKLHGELEVQSLDDVPPHVFWSSLLDDRSPCWLFLPDEPASKERRIPSWEALPEMSEGGLLETGVLDKEFPRWSRGRSNAKRRLRGRRCTWGLEERLQEIGQMVLMKHNSSKLAGGSVSCSTTHLADCITQGTEAKFSLERMGLSIDHWDISELIQQVEETHKTRMQELEQKQKREILEYFRTKNESRETMNKFYGLQKDLICELNGESLPNLDKLKELDAKFKIKRQGHDDEMDKRFENLQAAHQTARTIEEELRSKKIDLLKCAASTLPEDSAGAKVKAPSTSLDLGNPNRPCVESEIVINFLDDDEIYTSPTVISNPVSPLQELSPRERLNMVNYNGLSLDIIDVSPDSSPMEDLMAIPLEPDEFTDPVLLAEAVLSSSSPVEHLDTLDAPITTDDPIILPARSTLLHCKLVTGTLKESQRQVPKDFSVTESQGARKSVQDANDGVVQLDVEDFEVPLRSWTYEEVILTSNQNELSQSLPSSSVPITDSQSIKENGKCTSNGVVPCSDLEISVESLPTKEMTVAMGSVPVPVDEPAFTASSSIKQMDVLSAPLTPDNLSTSDCSPLDVLSAPITPDSLNISDCSPILESELEANILKDNQNHAPQNAISCSSPITENQGPTYGMQSSDELPIPSDTIEVFHDGLCMEMLDTYVDSDVQLHEISAATPVDRVQVANSLAEEVPVTSSEQLNPFSVGCSTNEPAACLSSMGNQHKEVQRMSDGVSTGGSSLCVALPGGEHGSMNQDTAVEELRQQQAQASTPADLCPSGLADIISFSMPQLNFTNQSFQLPLDQLPTTQPFCTEIRVTDGFSSLPSSQYVGNGASSQPFQSTSASPPMPDMCGPFNALSMQTDNQLMLHQIARGTVESTRPHLSDTTRNYHLNSSRTSDVRANRHQPASWDPLQIELERIRKANDEAMKKRCDRMMQLQAAQAQEMAQISQKYDLLNQATNNEFMQKKEELHLHYEKIQAHKSLAVAWAYGMNDNSPIDIMFPSSSTNVMQMGASAHPHHFPTDQFVRRPNPPPSYHPFYNSSELGMGPFVLNPYLRPSLPTASIPSARFPLSHSNQHALNVGSYSQPYPFGDYQAPFNLPI